MVQAGSTHENRNFWNLFIVMKLQSVTLHSGWPAACSYMWRYANHARQTVTRQCSEEDALNIDEHGYKRFLVRASLPRYAVRSHSSSDRGAGRTSSIL